MRESKVILLLVEIESLCSQIEVEARKADIKRKAAENLPTLQSYIQEFMILELPDIPRPRDCESITNEPGNCPDDRARGPPGL